MPRVVGGGGGAAHPGVAGVLVVVAPVGSARLVDQSLSDDDRRPLWGSLDQIRADVARYRDAGLDELFFELNFDPTIAAADADPKASMATALHLLEELAPST